MCRHDLSRPIRWGSKFKSKNGQLSQFSVADRMELNKLNVCFAPHNQQSGIDVIHEKEKKRQVYELIKWQTCTVHRCLLNFKLKTTKLNNLGTSTDINLEVHLNCCKQKSLMETSKLELSQTIIFQTINLTIMFFGMTAFLWLV